MSKLEELFIPLKESFDIKELEFNEECLAIYSVNLMTENEDWELKIGGIWTNQDLVGSIKAPTFSQAFRWFREKYNLNAEPYTADMGAIEYCFQIRNLYSEKYVYDNFRGAGNSYDGTFNTPEEAELACLIKLIELTKTQKL